MGAFWFEKAAANGVTDHPARARMNRIGEFSINRRSRSMPGMAKVRINAKAMHQMRSTQGSFPVLCGPARWERLQGCLQRLLQSIEPAMVGTASGAETHVQSNLLPSSSRTPDRADRGLFGKTQAATTARIDAHIGRIARSLSRALNPRRRRISL
jgi:hypothetical protein